MALVAKGRLAGVELWSDVPYKAGAVRIRSLTPTSQRVSVEALDNDDSCSFMAPLTADWLAAMVERQCIVYVYAPAGDGAGAGARDFFRYMEHDKAFVAGSTTVRITARGLIYDLFDAGLISRMTAGFREYEFTDTLSPSLWISTYVIPRLQSAGYTYITLGTVEPTAYTTIAPARWNAMQLMQELARVTATEFQLRDTGTGLVLDLVSEINGTLSPKALRQGRHLPAIRVRSNALQMATRIVPFGTKGHDPASRTVARVPWKITAIDVPVGDITVAPMDGSSATLLRFNQQYSTLSGLVYGWAIVVRRTGRAYYITDSFAGIDQKLRVSPDDPGSFGAAQISTAGIVVGDLFELREGVAAPARYRTDPQGAPLIVSEYPRRISVIAGSLLTLIGPWGLDPVPVDSYHVGSRVEANTLVLDTTTFTGDAQAYKDNGDGTTNIHLTTSSPMAVGDWGFISTANAEPYVAPTPSTVFWRIVQVVDATHINVVHRYPGFTGAPFLGAFTTTQQSIHVYRKRASVAPAVVSETAATNQITLDNAVQLAVNDYIEYYREYPADLSATIPGGANIARYGHREIASTHETLRGETNLGALNNPFFDTYTSAAGGVPPDGYTGFGTRVATGLIGPGQLYNVLTTDLLSPVVGPALWAQGDTTVTLRTRLRIPAAISWTGNGRTITILIEAADGSALIRKVLYPSDATTDPYPGYSEKVVASALVEANLTIELTTGAPGNPLYHGMKVHWTSTGTVAFLVGGWSLWQTTTPPEEGYFTKTSEGYALQQAGIAELVSRNAPEQTYEAELHDWSRLEAADAAYEMKKGMPVILDSATVLPTMLPVVRVSRIEWHHDALARTRIVVDTLRDTLTQQLAAGTVVSRAAARAAIAVLPPYSPPLPGFRLDGSFLLNGTVLLGGGATAPPGEAAPVVAPDPVLVIFTAVAGGANPAAQVVTIRNGGGSTLPPLLAVIVYGTGTPGWLTVNMSGGGNLQSASLFATVGALPAAPTRTAQIEFAPAGGGSLIGYTNVGFDVTSGVSTVPIVVSTPAQPLQFVATTGGANPASQSFAISNANAANSTLPTLVESVAYGANGPFTININRTGSGNAQNLQYTAQTAALTPKTYSATITYPIPGGAALVHNISFKVNALAGAYDALRYNLPSWQTHNTTTDELDGILTVDPGSGYWVP